MSIQKYTLPDGSGIEAVIFDLDGTLIDSQEQIATALNQILILNGHDFLARNIYGQKIGLPIESLLIDLAIDENSQSIIISEFRELYGSLPPIIYDNVYEILDFLIIKDIRIGIATTKPTYLAKKIVQNSPLSDFPIVIHGTDGFPAKPSPQVINNCLKELITVNAIMVGDRREDMEAAVNASIPGIGIATGFHSTGDLIQSGAAVAFQNHRELSEYIIKVI